ncbi:uncharacterized protein MELLADRAFT_90235 [Melampsora larici-populina 98AG31]|uniref:Uncharacterized protein n=1 Tax=Melampsora larici-populina (strain 98AG31 / pathotype 3-4-7) TaxID=747676 RepID=F4RW74_MELLP|nr:uncharacterized protein MELLADRAFT_90235 [Melampsora larici-populina 98AG31]EGG03234.1 hypothetical protein MELLADRAFT_90235 [Melampsora larici-populina 98AG31]
MAAHFPLYGHVLAKHQIGFFCDLPATLKPSKGICGPTGLAPTGTVDNREVPDRARSTPHRPGPFRNGFLTDTQTPGAPLYHDASTTTPSNPHLPSLLKLPITFSMDTEIYIKPEFLRTDPNKPLALPIIFHHTGFYCPACLAVGKDTPMKYINYFNNTWRVACGITPPRAKTGEPKNYGHWYRLWKDSQLKHELQSINAGNWPPLPYPNPSPVDHLPNTANGIPNTGSLTPSRSSLKSMFTPFTSTGNHLKSTTSAQPLLCRGVLGKTGQSHRIDQARQGNKQCIYQACASCCQTLGVQRCTAKRHGRPQNAPHAPPASSLNPSHPFMNRNEPLTPDFINPLLASSSPSGSTPAAAPAPAPAPAPVASHRRIALQCAQTGGRLAHNLSSTQQAGLFALRLRRNQETAFSQEIDTEENKVVSVIAWLKAGQDPELFTFHAPKWPLFTLQQCFPMVERAMNLAISNGETPTESLSLWDPAFTARRTVPNNLPNRLPITPRQFLVKSPQLVSDDCPRFDWFRNSLYESETGTAIPGSADSTSTHPAPPFRLANSAPVAHGGEEEDEVILVREQCHQASSNVTQPVITVTKQTTTPAAPNTNLAKVTWPNNEGPVSDLFEWYNLTLKLHRVKAWKICFGEHFKEPSDSTIHRYGRWIKIVEPPNILAWEQRQQSVGKSFAVPFARAEFRAQFQLAGSPGSDPVAVNVVKSPNNKTNQTDPQTRRKQKFGE